VTTLDGEQLMQHTWQVNPGSSTSTGYSWLAQAGTHALRWEASAADAQVAEEDEDNNILELHFTVDERDPNAQPDLLPCPSLADEAYDFSAGVQVNLPVCLSNQGTSAAYATIALYLDDALVYSGGWTINPGSSTSTGVSWVAQAGAHSLRWVADGGAQVVEADESNNSLEVAFSVA